MPDGLEFEGSTWSDRVAFSPLDGGFAFVRNSAFVRDSVDVSQLVPFAREDEHFAFSDAPTAGFVSVTGTFDALEGRGTDARRGGRRATRARLLRAQLPLLLRSAPGDVARPVDPRQPPPREPVARQPVAREPVAREPVAREPVAREPVAPNGPSRSSARPAGQPRWFVPPVRTARSRGKVATASPAPGSTRIVILDTGLASGRDRPALLSASPVSMTSASADVPDANNDRWLDPVAGHGTFIAGIIERIAPGCEIEVRRVLGPQGDGRESDVVAAIEDIALRNDPPAFLNLSFGGHVWEKAPLLSAAVLRAQRRGVVVVASAGNDGTCRPSYPAAIPGVVSVGAIGPYGPARFSNYGDWVRACAPGVDVVSSFFAAFDGLEVPSGGRDIDRFRDWAVWSGTSFAAPAVIGALVREMRLARCSPYEAVAPRHRRPRTRPHPRPRHRRQRLTLDAIDLCRRVAAHRPPDGSSAPEFSLRRRLRRRSGRRRRRTRSSCRARPGGPA